MTNPLWITGIITFAFLLFLSSFVLSMSAGAKNDSILHFSGILQLEKCTMNCVKAVICIFSFIQLAPKLIPCFWPIFTDFQNKVFISNLII